MSPIDNTNSVVRPTLFKTILVLVSILAGYLLVGGVLSFLATGGQSLESVLRGQSPPVLQRMLFTQMLGQVLVLGLPVFLLATRLSGGTPFGRLNLRWLGVGNGGGLRPALVGGFGMLLLQPCLYSIMEVQLRLLPMLGETGQALLKSQEQLDRLIRLLAGDTSPASLLSALLVFVLTPSICEELLFRGYLQKSLALNIKPFQAVFFSGLVFALFHLQLFNLLPLMLLGWYIGYLYLKTDNLLVPAVAHGANNLAALIVMHLGGGQAGHAGAIGSSSPIFLWPWWALVVVSLFTFSLLIRYFPEKPASAHAEKSMPGGRL